MTSNRFGVTGDDYVLLRLTLLPVSALHETFLHPVQFATLPTLELQVPAWFHKERLIRALLTVTREYDDWLVSGDALVRPLQRNWLDTSALQQPELLLFGVSYDGSAVRSEDLGGMPIEDLRRGVEEGLTPGPWDHLVLYPPQGLGGDGNVVFDWVRWAVDSRIFDWIGGAVTAKLLDAVPRPVLWRRRRALQRQARTWLEKGMSTPGDLRALVEAKDQWSSGDLAHKLKIQAEDADALLQTLGYEADAEHQWRRSSDPDATARRTRWAQYERSYWEPLYRDEDEDA
jgi:hypothetical protein